MESSPGSWKARTLLIGGAVGALTGVATALLLIRRSEQSGERLTVTPGEGVRLGLLVLGLLREIAALPDRES